ncbi:hypothetical protein [Erwinia oleae]|uniref:hypothetical protein n=1 Tax=Erwinia oleae TaxID=796334 RepID=UPI0005503DD1|nr:hypothetical protein [Erwinia oleae]
MHKGIVLLVAASVCLAFSASATHHTDCPGRTAPVRHPTAPAVIARPAGTLPSSAARVACSQRAPLTRLNAYLDEKEKKLAERQKARITPAKRPLFEPANK